MKRSEILLKIAKVLHSKAVSLDKENGTYTADANFDEFKELWLEDAEDILDLVEREGMMPPFVYQTYLNEFHKYGIGAANGHKWESEDEA